MQRSGYVNKSVTSLNKRYRELLKHEIVRRYVQQNYFCLPCQCSVFLQPTLINAHFKKKNHHICRLEHSTNEQQNLNNNINDKQSNVPLNIESPTKDCTNEQQNINGDINDKQSHVPVNIESPNESNFSAKIQAICKDKLVEDLSNDSTKIANGTIANIVPYSLMQEAETYKTQQAIHYRSWYCHLCKSMFQSMAKLKCHLEEAHLNNKSQLSDSLDKSVELSGANCRELNHETVMQDIPQDYFCVPSQSSTPSSYHFFEDLMGRKHERMNESKEEYITASIVLEDETHEATSPAYGEEHISKNDGSLKKCSINEAQVNTEQFTRNHSLIAASNLMVDSISRKNDTLPQNEESGFFISYDIIWNIKMFPKNPDFGPLLSCTKFCKKSALDRYNRNYRKEFLDFEAIMFAFNERKLKEIKLNLKFFVPRSNKIFCLVCRKLQPRNVQAIYEHINCEKHVTNFMKLLKNRKRHELLMELIKVKPTVYYQYAKCYKCYACDKNIKDYKCHRHFLSHRKNRKRLLKQTEQILEEFQTSWYNIQYFACVECNQRFKRKIEFMEHLDTGHKAVLSGKDNSKFNFCLTCATLWYKNDSLDEEIRITYERHCQQRMHQYLVKSNDFAVMSLPQTLQKLLSNVDTTVADMFKLSNDILNDPKVTQLRDALKHTFEANGLSVEVCMFGSRVTGLALPNSDIDVYLNFGDECIKPMLIKRSKQIQKCLRTDENWDIELVLDRSRTPLIKVKHGLTGLQCDISFTNGLSVENSKLIRSFNEAYPPCKKLTLFLKKWISLGGLTGSEGITNYALVWLIIFYLQVKFNIPNVAALIKSHNQSKVVSGWETGVSDTITINVPELPIHELLLKFFEYYGKFDYMYRVICPLLGKTKCCKRAFTEPSTLPDAMAPYIAQLGNNKGEYFRVDSPMCVQDPFDLSHNLTKAVSILTLNRFKRYCTESSSVLRKVKNATSSKMKKNI